MDSLVRKDLEVNAIKVVLIGMLNDIANVNSSTPAEAQGYLKNLRSRCMEVVESADINATRTPETNSQLRQQLKDDVDKIFNSIIYRE